MAGREEDSTITLSSGASDSEPDLPEESVEDSTTSEVQRYLRAPLDLESLSRAFGGTSAARRQLQSLAALLQDIEFNEQDYLPYAKYYFDQVFALLRHQPTEANGQKLQELMKLMRHSMKVRAEWPTRPVEDPRLGTAVEGTEHFMFEHESEGFIRLQWINPLPKPGWMEMGGVQCDVCLSQGLLASYQHVDEDNQRDGSSFFHQRIGFDLCAPCAATHITKRRDDICQWLGRVPPKEPAQSLRLPCAAAGIAPPEFSFSVTRFGCAPTGETELEVEVKGTGGLHAALTAMPASAWSDKNDAGLPLPSCWLTTGSQLGNASNVLSPQVESSCDSELSFQCASGDTLHFTASTVRGQLCCSWRSPTSGKVEHTVRAITLGQREAEFGGLRKSFACLSFPGVSSGEGGSKSAFLQDEDKFRILSRLHAVASQAGVVHNIPLQAPVQQQKPSDRDSSASASDSAVQNTSGVVSGCFVPLDWADLSDCMICLDRLDKETWLRGVPLRTHCGHFFHAMCLRKHQRGHDGDTMLQGCPNCRAPDPLKDAAHIGGSASLQWTLKTDGRGQAFQRDQCYRVVAVLCQDPLAVVDSAMVLWSVALQPTRA